MPDFTSKIVITGAAGLVGQNLIVRLKQQGWTHLVGIDKHPTNTAALRRLHPELTVIEADLARDDGWQASLEGAETLVIAHAQIGGVIKREFDDNNVVSTRRLMAAAEAAGVEHIVHLSSSVVNSAAVDWYTETKQQQEDIVLAGKIPCVVLRPTLMFGWFDRKHLGWLARFMNRVPVFPIPGDGKFRRQPLYVGNFCDIIIACIGRRLVGSTYNISGREVIDYIDLIREVRRASGGKAPIVCIPFWLFRILLQLYSLVNKNPPFTTKQLAALSIPELFEVIDWPGIFGVPATPLGAALDETFRTPPYSSIVLDF
jgi:nucleoside-diphosphate-sugar epimerase